MANFSIALIEPCRETVPEKHFAVAPKSLTLFRPLFFLTVRNPGVGGGRFHLSPISKNITALTKKLTGQIVRPKMFL